MNASVFFSWNLEFCSKIIKSQLKSALQILFYHEHVDLKFLDSFPLDWFSVSYENPQLFTTILMRPLIAVHAALLLSSTCNYGNCWVCYINISRFILPVLIKYVNLKQNHYYTVVSVLFLYPSDATICDRSEHCENHKINGMCENKTILSVRNVGALYVETHVIVTVLFFASAIFVCKENSENQ